jgi:hypothetical protein
MSLAIRELIDAVEMHARESIGLARRALIRSIIGTRPGAIS